MKANFYIESRNRFKSQSIILILDLLVQSFLPKYFQKQFLKQCRSRYSTRFFLWRPTTNINGIQPIHIGSTIIHAKISPRHLDG